MIQNPPPQKSHRWSVTQFYIANEILMHIRAAKKYSGDVYLQDVVGVDREGNEVRIEDKIADESDSID